MKFIGLIIFLLNFLITAPVIAQDQGTPDTLFLIPSELEAGAQDSLLTLELWCYNDPQGVSINTGFTWDSEQIELDHAELSPFASGLFSMVMFYDLYGLDTSNAYNRAMFAVISMEGRTIPPDPTEKKLIATYYFNVTGWDAGSSITFDTSSWDAGSRTLYISAGEAYVPVVVAGMVTDKNCCGLYTGGQTGNTNCDTEGVRNLNDIWELIDHVYLSKAPLCCPENGNVNGDSEGEIDITDIVHLIFHVYITKTETAVCE